MLAPSGPRPPTPSACAGLPKGRPVPSLVVAVGLAAGLAVGDARAQDAPAGPKSAPAGPKSAPAGPKSAPVGPKGAPAGSKDAQAEKTLAEAMGTDYLETRFEQAARKLRAAIEACGESGCSPPMKARLYVALGSVLAHGQKQLEDARDAFAEALRLDPNAKPDPDLSSAEVAFAFERARAAIGPAAPTSAAPAAPPTLQITPPAEQRARTPVPLFAEVRADLLDRVKQVRVWYQPPGEAEYRTLVMKKLRDRAFGINVPCSGVNATGALRYYLAALDKQGAIVAGAGSRDAPLATEIRETIASEPPHWPGFAPPATCAERPEERPSQCLDDRQCNQGFACTAGACAPRKPEPTGPPDIRRSWFSLSFSPDVALVSSDDACSIRSQDDQHFVCVRADKTRYTGTPTAGVANNVKLGFALGTLRVAVGYEQLLLDNLSVAMRLGLATRGASDGKASFLPLHLEGRAQYYLVPRPFERLGVRPFALASLGIAQVDAAVDVQVLEDADACGAAPDDTESPCTKQGPTGVVEPRRQTLRAYKQVGQGFASLGVGAAYAPLDGVSLNLAVRASLMFPVVSAVLSPEIGVGMGF